MVRSPYDRQYSEQDFVNEWDQSKKSIDLKIKEKLNLYYSYEDDSLNFPDGRKLDASRFPKNLTFKLTRQERSEILKLIEDHGRKRPSEVAVFLNKIHNNIEF